MLFAISICFPGPRADEAIEIIKQCQSLFNQIIITGYPPFLKLLVDSGIKENFGWDNRALPSKKPAGIFLKPKEGKSEKSPQPLDMPGKQNKK